MNENNDYRPENEGYSNPDNLYHYNYRSQEDQDRHEAPAVSKKPSFWHKTGVKITALLLAAQRATAVRRCPKAARLPSSRAIALPRKLQ